MRISEWWASGAAKRHILEDHQIEWYEIEEVLRAGPTLERGRRVHGEQRYNLDGRTLAGRPLRVVVAFAGSIARVVTAWER